MRGIIQANNRRLIGWATGGLDLQEVPQSPHIATSHYWGDRSTVLNSIKISIFVEMLR
jgi:hypothetical protein